MADLLRGTDDGIAFNKHFDGDGAIIFEHACALGCEGTSPSASVRPTAPAASITGSDQKVRGAGHAARGGGRLGRQAR